MTILIANQNQNKIEEFLGKKITFYYASTNTCIFKCTEKTFIILRNKVREAGINPYALMNY